MKIKAKILIPAVIILVLALATGIYLAVLEKFTVLQDEAWKAVMPGNAYTQLRWNLLKDGKRLKIITVEQGKVSYSEDLLNEFLKADEGGTIFASPTITAAINFYNIDVADKLVRTKVIGIGKDCGYFDLILLSDTVNGWEKAARSVSQDEVVALIYDSSTSAEAKVVYNIVKADRYNVDEYGNLLSSRIIEELDASKTSKVLCPYGENLQNFFDREVAQKWVVDYRYSRVVPEKNLCGVVYPDIYKSVKTAADAETGVLLYEYRSAE